MWYFTNDFQSDTRLNGKTVAITGGNNGIGKATVKHLYEKGARVIILSRNENKSKLAITEIKNNVKQINDHHDIRAKYLDLSDLSSVRKCAKEILDEENQINYLINNAGVMGNRKQLSKNGFELHFATNYLGHFLFTLLLLPRLIASGPARIINVSSVGHKVFYLSRRFDINEVRNVRHWLFQLEAYCQSKLAQVIFSKELARRLKDANINNVTTYSLHPGIAATDLFENWDMFLWGLAWLWGRFLCFLFFLTAEQASRTTLYCVLDEGLANQSGLYYSNCKEDTTNKLVQNEQLAQKLWDKSIEFTNLEGYNPFETDKK